MAGEIANQLHSTKAGELAGKPARPDRAADRALRSPIGCTAWLGLAFGRSSGVTKEKLQKLPKSQIEPRDVRRGLDSVVSGLKVLDLDKNNV
jgi:hypothetical protein